MTSSSIGTHCEAPEQENVATASTSGNEQPLCCRITGLRLHGSLDKQALQASLNQAARKHGLLDAVSIDTDGGLSQKTRSDACGVSLEVQDIDGDCQIDEICEEESLNRFERTRESQVRGRLLRLKDEEHVLLIVYYATISDSWSVRVFLDDLFKCYVAGGNAPADWLSYANAQSSDHQSHQAWRLARAARRDRIELWAQSLSASPDPIELPLDRPRPPVQELYTRARLPLKLSSDLRARLERMSQQAGVTSFDLFLSSWAAFLGRWSRQCDVVVGAITTNRHRPRDERVIGKLDATSAVRVVLHLDQTVRQLLQQVQNSLSAAQVHEDMPFEELLNTLARVPGQPLFRSFIRFDEAIAPTKIEGLNRQGLEISELDLEYPRTRLDIALRIKVAHGEMIGSVEYAAELFNKETVERMVASWQVLVEEMVAGIDRTVAGLSLLTASERQRIVHGFNQMPAIHSQKELIQELFEEQAERKPSAVALIWNDQTVTYAELNSGANRLARHLRQRGLAPDDLVAVCFERGVEMIVALLAVLKAGGGYIPLDPAYPSERLVFMIADAMPRILLTQKHLAKIFSFLGALDVVEADSSWRAIKENIDTNLRPADLGLTGRHLAYVIYTSGSTGKPKAAMNEHRGMVNRIIAQQRVEEFSEADICCQKTSLSFVDAVFEIFGPLCNGLPLLIMPPAAIEDSAELAALIAKWKVTRLTTVPSLAQLMLENAEVMRDLSGLRSWTLSGEEVRADLLEKLQHRLPSCEFIIQYGSSEISSDAAIYKTRNFSDERAPVGRPLPNAQIYVLDPYGEPVPVGVTGEIVVGGVGVGRGYLRRPELTASRFIADKFSDRSHARLYRTGDLGRWRETGTLDCLGRSDSQVKIRGFRVELGEIEGQLMRLQGVAEAAVVAREDIAGEKRLVAYFAPEGGEALGIEDVRAYLRAVLPEYMVPVSFVVVTSLPRTPNGKLNRRELPAPGMERQGAGPDEVPRGEVEETLAGIWQDLLRVDGIGRQGHFFDLGGDSLIAMRLVVRVKERFAIPFRAHFVFKNPVLWKMGAVVKDLVREGGVGRVDVNHTEGSR